jgi:carboxylesterase
MDTIKLLKGAAPFYFPGNEIGCLVVHGFTGTPYEMRWLGQYLNQQGFTVHGPRLAGHTTTIDDMIHTTWREWYISVLAAYEMLREQCRKVFVLGLSMGGSLSLMLASREPVDGIVAMSSPYDFHDWREPFLPLINLFVKTMPKSEESSQGDAFLQHVKAEQQARGEEPIGHPNYPARPVRAIRELVSLLAVMREGLPNVTAPALLIHSRADELVPFDNLDAIYNAINSPDKQKLVLEKSGHVVTEDVEREVVFKAAADFIKTHS